MSKFKPGDKVRCIDNTDVAGYIKQGKEYTVLTTDIGYVNLVETNPYNWRDHRFELVSNVVERPTHYNQGDIECIDAMASSLGPKLFSGYLHGNVFKYVWRFRYKGQIEDLKKARWYLNKLINLEESLKKELEKKPEGLNFPTGVGM